MKRKKSVVSPIRGRQAGKSDRRSGILGSDRRADRRRVGDHVAVRLAANDEARRRTAFARELRAWKTSALLRRLAQNAHADRHWENDLIAFELDQRVPPRTP